MASKRPTSKSNKASPAADPLPEPIDPSPAADPIPKNPKRKPKKLKPSSPDASTPNHSNSKKPPTPSDIPNPSHSTADPKPNPNPNPNPSPNPSPKKPKLSSPKPKPTTMTTDADSAASPRKSERKRKAREFPDDETPTAQPNQYIWSDDESLSLLRAVADFRAKTGINPISAAFFDSVKTTIPKHVTQDQVLNKIRRLRQKFRKSPAANNTPFYKISVEAWGGDAANDHTDKENGSLKEGEDIAESCPIVIREVSDYWKELGLPEEMIKTATKLVNPVKAKAFESKWHRHYTAELKLEVQRLELEKETYAALAAARGTSS